MPRINFLYFEYRCKWAGRVLRTARRANWILSCGEQKNWLGQGLCGFGNDCEYTVTISRIVSKAYRLTILIRDIQIAVQGSIMVESWIVAASICCEDTTMDCFFLLIW